MPQTSWPGRTSVRQAATPLLQSHRHTSQVNQNTNAETNELANHCSLYTLVESSDALVAPQAARAVKRTFVRRVSLAVCLQTDLTSTHKNDSHIHVYFLQHRYTLTLTVSKGWPTKVRLMPPMVPRKMSPAAITCHTPYPHTPAHAVLP